MTHLLMFAQAAQTGASALPPFSWTIWSGDGVLRGGLLLLVFTFRTSIWAGALGFAIMLACALVIERHARKLGKAGLESLTGGWRAQGGLRSMFGDRSRQWRDRFRRDDQ